MSALAEAQERIAAALERPPPKPPDESLDQLFISLRRSGMTRLTVGHEVRVASLLARLSELGHDLSDRAFVTDMLVPVLAISDDEEKLVRKELEAPAPAVQTTDGTKPTGLFEAIQRSGARALSLLGTIVGLLTGAFITWYYVFDRTPISPTPDNPDVSPVNVETFDWLSTVTRFLNPDLSGFVDFALSGVIVAMPIAVSAVLLLRERAHLKERLLRRVGLGGLFKSIALPEHKPILNPAATQAVYRALQEWQHLKTVPSSTLDVPATVRSAARNLGRPDWQYGVRRERPSHVFIVDRSGAADHLALLASVVEERLTASGILYERYEFRDDPRNLWSSARLAQQDRAEPLAVVAARHRGERLLLLSDGEALAGGALADFLEAAQMFSRKVMLHPVAESRWGRRERVLSDAGILIVPAAISGFERAAAVFSEETGVDPVPLPVGRGIDEDPFLADLRRHGPRYLSDIPLEEANAERLAKRIRYYLGRSELYDVFVAAAAFPKIDPEITLYLAEVLNDEPLDIYDVGLLARLPWLRFGRTPDWFRKVLLESLPPSSETRIRDLYKVIVAGADQATGTLPTPERASDLTKGLSIAVPPSLLDNLLERAQSLGFGEHIFLAFVREQPLSIDPPENIRRRWYQHLDSYDWAVFALGIVASFLAIISQSQIIEFLHALSDWGGTGRYVFLITVSTLEVLVFLLFAASLDLPLLRLLFPLLPVVRVLCLLAGALTATLGFALDLVSGLIALFTAALAWALTTPPVRALLSEVRVKLEQRRTSGAEDQPIPALIVISDAVATSVPILLSIMLVFRDLFDSPAYYLLVLLTGPLAASPLFVQSFNRTNSWSTGRWARSVGLVVCLLLTFWCGAAVCQRSSEYLGSVITQLPLAFALALAGKPKSVLLASTSYFRWQGISLLSSVILFYAIVTYFLLALSDFRLG